MVVRPRPRWRPRRSTVGSDVDPDDTVVRGTTQSFAWLVILAIRWRSASSCSSVDPAASATADGHHPLGGRGLGREPRRAGLPVHHQTRSAAAGWQTVPPRSPPSTGLNHHATNGRACVTIGYDLSRNPGHQIVLNLPFAPTGHGHLGRAAIHAASSTLSISVGDTFDDAGRLAALQLVGLGLVTMNE